MSESLRFCSATVSQLNTLSLKSIARIKLNRLLCALSLRSFDSLFPLCFILRFPSTVNFPKKLDSPNQCPALDFKVFISNSKTAIMTLAVGVKENEMIHRKGTEMNTSILGLTLSFR